MGPRDTTQSGWGDPVSGRRERGKHPARSLSNTCSRRSGSASSLSGHPVQHVDRCYVGTPLRESRMDQPMISRHCPAGTSSLKEHCCGDGIIDYSHRNSAKME